MEKVWFGTSYFVSRVKCLQYYQRQEVDREYVNNMLCDGSISIGKPPFTNDEDLKIDSDGRYHKRG